MLKPKILITGANGQIGKALTLALVDKHGRDAVLATDIREQNNSNINTALLDVTDLDRLRTLVKKYEINQIYHLAAVLSAKGELTPLPTWDLNMKTWLNVLQVAKEEKINKVFFPSSIAVFGHSATKDNTPQSCHTLPDTVYGMTKVAGENWAYYYYKKYGLDVRSLRYPGLISTDLPGGGTTDYAVEIFHKAISDKKYTCFLEEDTALPMMYMPDAIRATINLMEAPKDAITIRNAYNLQGFSFTPKVIANAIKAHIPEFEIDYKVDARQEIADSWPNSVDDKQAQQDWAWAADYSMEEMVADMLEKL